ncbi:uncharacterized protein LOC122370077 [Amphibalanus amphitrite]|uniref:uncharacterized protein LOC122370077 n=1 Tax=Amphibalanus amphitrite TaxID=1232801 RepID=UPI001C90608E|nr:uncharacterized protein LOC122370077 [Amphibalanus amphitrite]
MLASPENTDDLGESTPSGSVDGDEVLLRRQALHDNLRDIFDKVDPEGFGEVLAVDFLRAMSSAEFVECVDVGKRVQLADRIRSGELELVTYQEFVNVMTG